MPNAPHFSQRFTLDTGYEESQLIPDYLYTGKLADDPESHIHGAIIDGRFSGTIYTDGKEEYHVENSRHHFDEKPDFHSIIYKSSDVDFDEDHGGGCGSKEEILARMAEFQETAIDDDDGGSVNWSQKPHVAGENKYSHPNHQNRRRRQSNTQTSCHLFLQADHTFWEHYYDGNRETAVQEVITSLNNHVSHVSQIYSHETFGPFQNLDFIIDRIKVNTSEDKDVAGNPFADEFIGVEKFLELNSLQNHDQYCLAYVFADRDFNDGVLGLAWVGSPESKTSGGICEKHKTFSGGVSQSLNTGIVTIQNYGSTVPSKVSYITFAHELGHNYGSPHDYPAICKPGESTSTRNEGNYIMYPSATSGDKPNNNKFSPCSKENMTNVLQEKATCFVESGRPVCGNRIVEGDEECDCGYEEQCLDDPCCHARPNNGSLPSTACKLKIIQGIKAECSPSVGPCCGSNCLYVAASANETCSGSVCLNFDLEECFCEPPQEGDTVDQSCHLCCMDGGVCKSSTQIESMENYTLTHGEIPMGSDSLTKALFQQPGSPCNAYLGYCDVFYKCRLVDSNGPLSRLTKAIFNPDLYEDVFSWIQEYWWATILICLGVIILMALFIKCFSVHTPSSNPNMKQARKVSHYTNTLRRRPRPQPGTEMRTR
ncbi:ADAM10 metallopeptidase [Apostichopus japonicus]|uniref:ADAM10 endopeptidase n=1 Tax=Stichopus japonicus TaxID=307972 RepID=A0A2G8LCB8_STIJA|nr:ADAM10 metallopeptidase [Apostichopus japonicus]